MRTTLDIVIALTTSILFSGALVGAAILAACGLSAGTCWWAWRWIGKRRKRDQ